MPDIRNLRVAVPDWIWEHWRRVAYLIIGPGGPIDVVNIRPDERFNKTVTSFLRGYVEEGKMPPAEIAPAILNLGDDFLAGRELTLRAGDYVAIQNYLRRSG